MKGPWESNLAALRGRPSLGPWLADLEAMGPAPDLGLRNRQGQPVPGWVDSGRPRALSSTYDPGTEAARWCEGWAGGTAVVFGGAGRAAADALGPRGLRLAFWVEPRREVWRSLFTWEDWTPWLTRDEWVPVTDLEAWGQTFRNRYHPLWDGGLRAFEWRGAGSPGLWEAPRKTLAASLDAVASDASTQARFGERWYRNTLTNLRRLKPESVPSWPGARVVVAGAGPSLEDALSDPQNLDWLGSRTRTGDRLVCADTALPALTARGVVPDVVFCLDGQLASYHHFVPAHPPAPVVADLASLPLFDRLGVPVVRYLSGHPLGRVIHRWFPELPTLDGSLGNVSGLAWQTAWALGARTVDTWGVDFAYRDGQAYARGTYVYDLAGRRADRLVPLETRLGASCYGARGRERTLDQGSRAWDTTPLLRDYRRRWEAAFPTPGTGVLSHRGAEGRWNRFRDDWTLRLERLPLPPSAARFHPFVRGLTPETREDWWALWPLALALHRGGVPVEELPRTTRDQALTFLHD